MVPRVGKTVKDIPTLTVRRTTVNHKNPKLNNLNIYVEHLAETQAGFTIAASRAPQSCA